MEYSSKGLLGLWGKQPAWAHYAVVGCSAFGGIFWASTIRSARLVARYHGGNVKPLVYAAGE